MNRESREDIAMPPATNVNGVLLMETKNITVFVLVSATILLVLRRLYYPVLDYSSVGNEAYYITRILKSCIT